MKVVNPVSFGDALSTRTIQCFWEATAGSTLIFDALKATDKAPFDFADEFETATLDSPDALEAPTVALLYQGGYLTIDQRIDDETVLLKIPNQEVRQSLERGYISRLLGKDFALDALQQSAKKTARRLAAEGYTETIKTMLQSAYARLPHDWSFNDEKEVKRYFLAFMVFANADVVGEEQHATDTVKLATRQHANPDMVISAYERGSFDGNLLDLFEPGFSPAFYPQFLDNTAFPSDWFEKTSHCARECTSCGYCEQTFRHVAKSFTD